MEADGEGGLEVMIGEAGDLAGDPHSGNRDVALSDADILVHRSNGFDHGVCIQERLTHAHEHDVTDAMSEVGLNGENLIHNLVAL